MLRMFPVTSAYAPRLNGGLGLDRRARAVPPGGAACARSLDGGRRRGTGGRRPRVGEAPRVRNAGASRALDPYDRPPRGAAPREAPPRASSGGGGGAGRLPRGAAAAPALRPCGGRRARAGGAPGAARLLLARPL